VYSIDRAGLLAGTNEGLLQQFCCYTQGFFGFHLIFWMQQRMDSDAHRQAAKGEREIMPAAARSSLCAGRSTTADEPYRSAPFGCEAIGEDRILSDPWIEPPARRAIGFYAIQRLGAAHLAHFRVDPIPFEGSGHNLHWLCFGRQDEVDDWRTSTDHVEETLAGIERWLNGEFLTYGGAVAASFPLALLVDTVLADWTPRQRDVILARTEGVTLEALGSKHNLTRERIRQIADDAVCHAATRLYGLKAVKHPAALGIQSHMRRLATIVLTAASEKEGILRPVDRRRWISEALAPADANTFLLLLWLQEAAAPDEWPLADPFAGLGVAFQDGVTLSRWRDEHVAALRVAFVSVARGDKQSWAELPSLRAAAGFDQKAIETLAAIAGLSVLDGYVFSGRPSISDFRRIALTGILSRAGRAMHVAEIMEIALADYPDLTSSLRTIRMAMSDDTETFVTDGHGLWQLRQCLGDLIEDARPDHPEIPPPPSRDSLLRAFNVLASTGWTTRPRPLLAGLDPHISEFAIVAGAGLAAKLASLPSSERRSVAQILHADDEPPLIEWLQYNGPVSETEGAPGGGYPSHILSALTLLAALVSVIRTNASSDSAYWPLIVDACSEVKRQWLFNSQRALRTRVMALLVEVAATFNLRRAFSFQSDPWVTLLDLQAGLSRKDLPNFPLLLSAAQPPVMIGQLVAPGPNYSAVMACTWHALRGYRNQLFDRGTVEVIARHSDWWPGWSLDEACQFADERRSRPWHGAPEITFDRAGASNDPIDTKNSEVPDERCEPDPRRFLGTPEICLDRHGTAFIMPLPNWLSVSPGPITLLVDDARAGGTILDNGTVRWFGEEKHLRLPLRGPPERTARLERSGAVLTAQPTRLWAPAAYFQAFPLDTGSGRPFDPFVTPMPAGGGVALLLHRDLKVSARPDDEVSLDRIYVLQLFRGGVPAGTTVSCEGEVLWEAPPREDARIVDPSLGVTLDLADRSAWWGERTDLILSQSAAGFIPQKARIGTQTLGARPDGGCWRFPDFALLPGMDTLRRRGRVDGELNGTRISVPAHLSLARAAAGAALRDNDGWRSLRPEATFNVAFDGSSRLWVCLPDSAVLAEWTIFEGIRPVVSYREHGVRLERHLLCLGEALTAEPGRYNRDGSGIRIATLVTDTGVIRDGEQCDHTVLVRLSTTLSWTEHHKAYAFSSHGIADLDPVEGNIATTVLKFRTSNERYDGLAIFHNDEWLGTWVFVEDLTAALRRLLTGQADPATSIKLAINGRLPVLASEIPTHSLVQSLLTTRSGLEALCNLPRTERNGHAIRCLLECWQPKSGLAETILQQSVQPGASKIADTKPFERLAEEAPCAAIRILIDGITNQPKFERRQAVARLAGQLVNNIHAVDIPPASVGAMVRRAEQQLLEAALVETHLDQSFLASKSAQSIASLAWAHATSIRPERFAENLATAMTIAPVRRWLMATLLSRLITEIG
jgi:hypothetical protein